MKRVIYLLGICCVFILSGKLSAQQDSTLIKVLSEPGHWFDKQVRVRGIVEEHIPFVRPYREGEQRTIEFLLRGDFGNRVRVRSHFEAPETNKKYEITGIFQLSGLEASEEKNYFPEFIIIETGRQHLDEVLAARVAQDAVATKEAWWDRNGLYVLIAAGAVVLILIILLLVLAFRKPSPPPAIKQAAPAYSPPPHPPAQPQPQPAAHSPPPTETPAFSTPGQYKTIKLAVNAPKTMRFMPGSLEIMSSEDKGKVFRMAGYPTEHGSIVTLGRDAVSGQRGFSHIQLNDKTVSRKQAEIIYRDGKILLKNISETNYTQVDGQDIEPNSAIELHDGSIIRTGAVEFKYRKE